MKNIISKKAFQAYEQCSFFFFKKKKKEYINIKSIYQAYNIQSKKELFGVRNKLT